MERNREHNSFTVYIPSADGERHWVFCFLFDEKGNTRALKGRLVSVCRQGEAGD